MPLARLFTLRRPCVQILEANPEAELPPEEEPKVSSTAVLRYMCQEQQIDTLLANNRFMVSHTPFGAAAMKSDRTQFRL